MNSYIVKAVEQKYGFDPNLASIEELCQVEEISARDVTGVYRTAVWNFSAFPNLKKIDCSFNGIEELNVRENTQLEEICWQGVRGELHTIDFSQNKHLKKIEGGQDGMVELDLAANTELEEIEMWLNYKMRWLNVDNCKKLKRIVMKGIILPFIDLTHCEELEYVDINYLNLYARKLNEFGPGYPRPIIFVRHDFDESVIPQSSRNDKYYNYFLVRVKKDSVESRILSDLKSEKQRFMSIYADRYGEDVANEHYRIMSILQENK